MLDGLLRQHPRICMVAGSSLAIHMPERSRNTASL